MRVSITDEALVEIARLPGPIRPRIEAVLERLERWPKVSGVKWLTETWKLHARIRTGDYRVIFKLISDNEILVVRIAHRKDAYAE